MRHSLVTLTILKSFLKSFFHENLTKLTAKFDTKQENIIHLSQSMQSEVRASMRKMEAILSNGQKQFSLISEEVRTSRKDLESLKEKTDDIEKKFYEQKKEIFKQFKSTEKTLRKEGKKNLRTQSSLHSTVEEFMKFMVNDRSRKSDYFKIRLDKLEEKVQAFITPHIYDSPDILGSSYAKKSTCSRSGSKIHDRLGREILNNPNMPENESLFCS